MFGEDKQRLIAGFSTVDKVVYDPVKSSHARERRVKTWHLPKRTPAGCPPSHSPDVWLYFLNLALKNNKSKTNKKLN